MQLLTDEEIGAVNFVSLNRLDYEVFEVDQISVMEFARAIESALLAKLGAMELPEPVCEVTECGVMGQQTLTEIDGRWKFLRYGETLYTSDAMRKAYAQGAAAQLSHEPLCYVRNGEINRWNGLSGMGFSGPLYTRREAK